MKIKTFPITAYDEATEFVSNVVLTDNGVQFSDSNIVVTYYETKENYEDTFVAQMREGLERNLFHEKVRQAVAAAEYNYRKDKGTNQKGFDEAQDKQREVETNIQLFEAKIKALDEWTASKS